MNVFVSGIGLVTPLGASREKTWSRLINGESAIIKSEHGLEARVFDFSLNGARSRMGDFALLATAEALRHAGLDRSGLSGQNIGCAVSQSKPLLTSTLDPTLVMSSFFGWSSESVVRREFKLDGPSSNLVAACATGVASIQVGVQWIQSGLCDIALVGASESSLNSFYRAGFKQMGVLANEENGAQPFDRNRSGFVMGEGAAVMVIESEASLRRRGKKALARILKTVLRQSSFDILRFESNGNSVASLISQIVSDTPIPNYINAHGTGTLMNDLAETRGIKKALGNRASSIPVSSTKAATGHLLGAAGAVEAAFAVLTLEKNLVPPTINLSTPDPDCDLDYVVDRARPIFLESTMSLSYGFGGQMGAVMFGRAE